MASTSAPSDHESKAHPTPAPELAEFVPCVSIRAKEPIIVLARGDRMRGILLKRDASVWNPFYTSNSGVYGKITDDVSNYVAVACTEAKEVHAADPTFGKCYNPDCAKVGVLMRAAACRTNIWVIFHCGDAPCRAIANTRLEPAMRANDKPAVCLHCKKERVEVMPGELPYCSICNLNGVMLVKLI